METSIRYTLLRRKNQKHVRIRINGNGSIRVSAPASMSLRRIEQAVKTREAWIRRQSGILKERFESFDPARIVLVHGETFTVDIRPSESGRNRVSLSAARKRVLVQCGPPERETASSALSGWLKRKARKELLPLVRQWSEKTGIPFKKLYIRDQTSRWGSSSGRGNISLNFRLVMAPPAVQRYLVIHELCHQRNFNHSRDYWTDVARYCPDYLKAEGWLKEHAVLLSLFR